MGTPGVPCEISYEELILAIAKFKGKIVRIAKYFEVDRITIYTLLSKYPELKPVLKEYRNARKESLLDSAEDVVEYALEMCKENDLTNSLKAAFFFLKEKGDERGYKPRDPTEKSGVQTEDFVRLVQFFSEFNQPKESSASYKAKTDNHTDSKEIP